MMIVSRWHLECLVPLTVTLVLVAGVNTEYPRSSRSVISQRSTKEIKKTRSGAR